MEVNGWMVKQHTMRKIIIILAIVKVTNSFTTRHSISLCFRPHIHPYMRQPQNGKIQRDNSFGPLGRRRILSTRSQPLYMAGKSSSLKDTSGYNLDLPKPLSLEETLRREKELREIEERIKEVDNRRLQIMQEILSEAESARDLVEKKKVTKGEIVDKEKAELTALECELLELENEALKTEEKFQDEVQNKETADAASRAAEELQLEAQQAAQQAAEDAKKMAEKLQNEAQQAALKLQSESKKTVEKLDMNRKDRDINLGTSMSSMSGIAGPASIFGGFVVAAVTARSMLQNREEKQEELKGEIESRAQTLKNNSSIENQDPIESIGPTESIENQALIESSEIELVKIEEESNQSAREFDVSVEGEITDKQTVNSDLIIAETVNEDAVESSPIEAEISDQERMIGSIIEEETIDQERMIGSMIGPATVNEEAVNDSVVEQFEEQSNEVSTASIQEISVDIRDDVIESIQVEIEPMNGVEDKRPFIQEELESLQINKGAYAAEEQEESAITYSPPIDVPDENDAVTDGINAAPPDNIDHINQVKGSANTSSLFSRNADYESTIEEEEYFDSSSFESVDISTLGHTPTIKVIGVGDGGNFAIEHMLKFHDPASEEERIEFWALNSDSQSLGRLMRKGINALIIGSRTAGGLGAGGDPSVGKLAAEESREDIGKVVSGADVCFITGALGSGTGSGATPVISEIAKENGALTLAIVTTPFPFEGKKRARRAREAIENLQETADSVVLIMNRNLLEIIPNNMSLEASFRVADEMLRRGVEGISDMIKSPGLLVVDHLDLRGVLMDSGVAAMGIGTGRGKRAACDAAMAAITSPLLVAPVSEANKIVLNIVGGESLTLQKVNEAARIICGNVYEDANIVVGAQVNPDFPRDKITVTVIAAGFQDTQ